MAAKRKSRANSKIRDEIRKSLSSTVTLRRTFEKQQLERRQLLEKRLTEKKPKRPAVNETTTKIELNETKSTKLNETTTVLATNNGTFVKTDEKKTKRKEKICDVVYLKTIDNLLNAINGRLEYGKINSNFKDDANYIDIFQENISKLSSHLHAKLKFNAGLRLLRWYRGRLEIRKAREQLNHLRTRRNAAVVIQSAWRSHQARKAFRALVAQKLKERRDAAVLTIQKNYRLHSVRKQSNRLKELERQRNAAASVIQRSWRVYVFRSKLNRLMEQKAIERSQDRAAFLIQRNWKQHVFKTRLAGLVEQRRVDRLRDQSASLIQRNWKGYVFRKRFDQMVEAKQQVKCRSALLLQKAWRAYLLRKSLRQNLNSRIEQRRLRVLNESASLIQRNWKIYQFRKHLCKLIERRQTDELVKHCSAMVVQRAWRSYGFRKHLNALTEAKKTKNAACLTVQRAWRRFQFVKLLKDRIRAKRLRSDAALLIQSNWRVYQAKKRLNQLKLVNQRAAQLIQRNWRSYVFRKNLASRMKVNQETKRNKAALVVQRAWRGWLAERRRLAEQRKVSAAIRIQSAWRGYAARLNCIRDHKNASIILGRISEVNKNAFSQPTVGEKTKIAISKLLNYKYHGTALQLLQELENTTNLSNESCIQMADQTIIEVLLKVISECNRSEPCLQIIKLAYSVILNIAKNEKALPLLCSMASLKESIVMTLNKHYKKTGIFLKAMTLLYILLKYDNVSLFRDFV